jgi:hypothetical protein
MPEWTDVKNKELTARQVALAKLLQNYFGDTKIKFSTSTEPDSLWGKSTGYTAGDQYAGQYNPDSDSIAVYTNPWWDDTRVKGGESGVMYHEMAHRAQLSEIDYYEKHPVGRLKNLLARLSGKGDLRARLAPNMDYEPFAEGMVNYITDPRDSTISSYAKSIYDKLLRGDYKRK